MYIDLGIVLPTDASALITDGLGGKLPVQLCAPNHGLTDTSYSDPNCYLASHTTPGDVDSVVGERIVDLAGHQGLVPRPADLSSRLAALL
jgi:hypothetical protein